MEAVGAVFMVLYLGVAVYVLSLAGRLVRAVEKIPSHYERNSLDRLVQDSSSGNSA